MSNGAIACWARLRAHFAGAGLERIENVRVVRDPKTGLGKGIAFVAFATEETAVAVRNTRAARPSTKLLMQCCWLGFHRR